MNKKERKKENKDLERVPFVTVRQTDRNRELKDNGNYILTAVALRILSSHHARLRSENMPGISQWTA